jgi:hypothetical protein
MKAIIYTGIALFSAASVYGLTDYYKSNKNGSLNNLYKETELQEKVYSMAPLMKLIAADNEAVALQNSTAKEKKEQLAEEMLLKNLSYKTDRRIDLEDFSRGRIAAKVKREDLVSMDDSTSVSDIVPVAEKTIDSTKN